MDGVAMKYLQESFDAHTAPISHRSVAPMCREILRALLPLLPAETKSSAKSKNALSDLVCQSESDVEFEQAIGVLEKELRLISAVGQGGDGKPLYSLTHDYLVKPVREWIFEHEQSTWQGRARSKMTSLAARYACEPSYRSLPSVSEWLAIQSSVRHSRRTESERHLMRSARRVVYAKLLSSVAAIAILLCGTWLVVRGQYEVWQLERNRAVVAIDLFLASKPSGLELAQRGILDLKRPARTEYAERRYLGEPGFDRRLTMLGALLGASLEAGRVVKAIDESEIDAQPVWRTALANASLRDSVLRASSFDSRLSARVHWLFLANNDFRTIDSIEQSDEPSAIVLCHQIAACALEETAWAASWNAAKLEKIVAEKPLDSELHALATLLIGLVSPEAPSDITRIERQAVASRAVVAMPAQWYIVKSKNCDVEFIPAQPDASDWRIEKPLPNVSIPMIRLPAGEMVFTPARKEDLGGDGSPFLIIVDEGLWVTSEKIRFEVASEFAKAQTVPLGFEIGSNNGYAYLDSANAVFRFCNWLSEVSGYKPAYKFKESSPNESEPKLEETNGVFIRPDVDGFRIPTRDEFFYIATCGEQSAVIDALYANAKMFNGVRTNGMRQLAGREPFLSTPSPWGIKNIFSLPSELFNDQELGKLASAIPGEISRDNFRITPPVKDFFLTKLAIRLVRRPIRTSNNVTQPTGNGKE